MTKMLIDQLADFAAEAEYKNLPDEVVLESKRVILDSVGCALAGVSHPKGSIGIEYGSISGGPGGSGGDATIIGTRLRSSVAGAAFANGELISALDFDAILPPGHVAPYVLPGAMAVGESLHSTGEQLITAVAIAHEMSFRFGKAMDLTRDTSDGGMSTAPVLGYASTIFGATAAINKLQNVDRNVILHGLAIAGSISPVNSHRSWMAHAPSSTVKYTAGGVISQSAVTAAYLAQLGHRGDIQTLDDSEYGYRQFINTRRWEPAKITDRLGDDWRFPAEHAYKPYPHCRIMHSLFDGVLQIVEENDIRPEEITAIRGWGEAWVMQPVWLNTDIQNQHDAQFSMTHGLAVAAHRISPRREWQSPEVVFNPSVLELMSKSTFAPHPGYVDAITNNPGARPARVEIDARNTTFSAERDFPHGSPSPDPATYMTNEELVAKFYANADGVIPEAQAQAVVSAIFDLEEVDNVRSVFRDLRVTDKESVGA
ncbi:MmgE/PrpD family protein [Arthrobacter sp. NPDC093128]|uniref:MmgE/PrpD family protein n=1 Tax=Arthrobacter sp. NPDC093128 TaxID=3154979 RepID=UPI003438781D